MRAKIHHNYSVAEAAKLYGVHRNTVRGWLRCGLGALTIGREKIILGDELRRFLEARRASRRATTPPGSVYCMRCRAPRRPAEDLVELIQVRGATANVRAICGDCGGLMHRHVNLHRLEAAGFGHLGTEADSHLADSPSAPVNCHQIEDA